MNARSQPETVWAAKNEEAAKAHGALPASRGLMTRQGDPVFTWTEIRRGALRGLQATRWRALDGSAPPADVLDALVRLVGTEAAPAASVNVGQLVRGVDDAGTHVYGRMEGIHTDGEKALYAVKGREARLVEHVEAVDFDDLEQVEAWLESGVD